MTNRTLTRALTRLLPAAAVLGAGLTLVAPPAAQAMDDLTCGHWSQKGWSIEDPEYGEVFVIEARCDVWIWEPPIVDPPGPVDPGKTPPGTGDGGDKEPKTCADVKDRIADVRSQLAGKKRAALATSVQLTATRTAAAIAWAVMESERSDVEHAQDEVNDAKLAYLAQAGIDGIEREVRNGAVVVRPANVTRANVDRSLPTGRALVDAMDDLSKELLEEHAAEYDYGRLAGQADAYAAEYTRLQSEIDVLQRELVRLQAAQRACTP